MVDEHDEIQDTPPPKPTVGKLGHIVWCGPHDPPALAIESWIKMNPDMIWTVWKDHTAAAGWGNQSQIDARAARGEWNGVADAMRYEILYRCGGVAVDADSYAEKPLSEGDFFNQETAFAVYENESVRPGIVGCGFLGAPRGHVFFKRCVDDVAVQDPSEMAWKTVGPMLMTRVARALPEMIRVYPARTANPTHYTGAKAPGAAPIYANQAWGSTMGYNKLRKWPCQCAVCRAQVSMIRAPWG